MRQGRITVSAGGTTAVVAVGIIAAVALSLRAWSIGGHSLAFAWAAVYAVPLVVTDLREHRLPDAFTLPSGVGVVALLWAADAVGDRSGSALRATAAAVVLAGCLALLASVAPLGLGDAKLALTCGALTGWYGWEYVLVGVVAAFVVAALYGGVRVAARRARASDPVPFGPFLMLGTALAIAWPF